MEYGNERLQKGFEFVASNVGHDTQSVEAQLPFVEFPLAAELLGKFQQFGPLPVSQLVLGNGSNNLCSRVAYTGLSLSCEGIQQASLDAGNEMQKVIIMKLNLKCFLLPVFEIDCQFLPVIVFGQTFPQQDKCILPDLWTGRILSNMKQSLADCWSLQYFPQFGSALQ